MIQVALEIEKLLAALHDLIGTSVPAGQIYTNTAVNLHNRLNNQFRRESHP